MDHSLRHTLGSNKFYDPEQDLTVFFIEVIIFRLSNKESMKRKK